MEKKKKHIPSSIVKYDKSHPVISFRVEQKLYDKFRALLKEKNQTPGDFFREVMDKQKPDYILSDEQKIMDRLTIRAEELFSKGFTNLAIRDELTVYFPEITEENIQSLREKWEQKQAADMEMPGGTEEGKETPLPSQKNFVDYLKPRTLGYEKILDNAFGKTKWKHWIRYDEAGFAFPSVEDWVELKKVLNLDDTFDLSQTGQKTVFDEPKPTGEGMEEKIIEKETEKKLEGETLAKKTGVEGTELGKGPIPLVKDDIQKEMIRDDKDHTDSVRVIEELRCAITSERHAQKMYENAKEEMEEMIRVRSELEKLGGESPYGKASARTETLMQMATQLGQCDKAQDDFDRTMLLMRRLFECSMHDIEHHFHTLKNIKTQLFHHLK